MNALTRSILRALEGGGRAPHPGRTALYRLYNWVRELIYIGITNNIYRRMRQHARTQPWWGEVREAATEIVWYARRVRAAQVEIYEITTAGVPLYNIEHNPIRLHRGGQGVARRRAARQTSGLGPAVGLTGAGAGVLAGHVAAWWMLSPGWLVTVLAITGLSGALVRKGLR